MFKLQKGDIVFINSPNLSTNGTDNRLLVHRRAEVVRVKNFGKEEIQGVGLIVEDKQQFITGWGYYTGWEFQHDPDLRR
jgi:hypothetical protein